MMCLNRKFRRAIICQFSALDHGLYIINGTQIWTWWHYEMSLSKLSENHIILHQVMVAEKVPKPLIINRGVVHVVEHPSTAITLVHLIQCQQFSRKFPREILVEGGGECWYHVWIQFQDYYDKPKIQEGESPSNFPSEINPAYLLQLLVSVTILWSESLWTSVTSWRAPRRGKKTGRGSESFIIIRPTNPQMA